MKVKAKMIGLITIVIACISMFIVGVFAVTELNFKVTGSIEYTAPIQAEDESEYPNLIFTYNSSAMTASVKAKDYYITGDIEIPGHVKYNNEIYKVTSIENSAFGISNESWGAEITSVTIPNTIESIGYGAFNYCIVLTSVNMGNGLKTINGSAFFRCDNLTSITIPSSVTSIGNSVFGYCHNLESIVVEDGNDVYDSRDNCNAIIETSSNTLIEGCKNTIIPENVASLGDFAFYGVTGLLTIDIPNSVQSIGQSTFKYCSALTHAIIGNGITSIGDYAFDGCSNLTTLTIDSSTIAGALSGTDTSACGGLIAKATSIYVKTDIVSSLNSYVTTNYTKVETITSGEYAGYTKYSK